MTLTEDQMLKLRMWAVESVLASYAAAEVGPPLTSLVLDKARSLVKFVLGEDK